MKNKAMQEILGVHQGQPMNKIPSDIQDNLIDYLENLIPDLEDIMLEKALDFKENLLKLRISILEENFETEVDILAIISRAHAELDNGNARQAIDLLNEIPDQV